MDELKKKKILGHLEKSRATFHAVAAISLLAQEKEDDSVIDFSHLRELAKREQVRLINLMKILRDEWGIEYMNQKEFEEIGVTTDPTEIF